VGNRNVGIGSFPVTEQALVTESDVLREQWGQLSVGKAFRSSIKLINHRKGWN
jgi:hypothetical protein